MTKEIEAFNLTKYGLLYIKIIQKAKNEDRRKLKKDNPLYIYYELHHILPKSIYLEYKNLKEFPSNGILLTAREHFICHILLVQHYRKMNLKENWHKMTLALSKLKCNNKYNNSRLFEDVRKNYSHSEETIKNISAARRKKAKIVYVYNNTKLVERVDIITASEKYFKHIRKTNIDYPYGSNGGLAKRKILENKNLDKYFGWFISDFIIDNEVLKIKNDIFKEKIDADFKTIYVYKFNELIDVINLYDFNKKYPQSVKRSSIDNIVGNLKESQYSLKRTGSEHLIGVWISEEKIEPKIDFANFGKEYSEKKKKFNVLVGDEVIYKNITKPELSRLLPKIKHALFKTSKQKPLGYGHYKQTDWLIKNNLLEKYKGYYIEESFNGIR
jgi:hypothetical protein